MKIGCIAQNLDNLKCRRLLSGDPIRVNRIHNDKAVALAKLPHDSKCIIKVSINRHDFRSVGESLH